VSVRRRSCVVCQRTIAPTDNAIHLGTTPPSRVCDDCWKRHHLDTAQQYRMLPVRFVCTGSPHDDDPRKHSLSTLGTVMTADDDGEFRIYEGTAVWTPTQTGLWFDDHRHLRAFCRRCRRDVNWKPESARQRLLALFAAGVSQLDIAVLT
jgi:hypothetical protein